MAGIQEKLEAPGPFSGNVYAAQQLPRIAASLAEATERIDQSVFAREAFGDSVIV